MISDKITYEDVLNEVINMNAGTTDILLPSFVNQTDYKSFKPSFDVFKGSRARCFCCAMYKHSFSELVNAEKLARNSKLSKNDVTNLFERLNQILVSFFSQHSKGDVRSEYKNQYLAIYRNYK